MRHCVAPFAIAFCLLALAGGLSAQPVSGNLAKKNYQGYRVSLYGFKLLDQSERAVTLRCNVVNTGRFQVVFNRDKRPPESLIVELDSLALPERLKGAAADVAAAFLEEKINLTPGQLQQGITLKIVFGAKNKVAELPQVLPQTSPIKEDSTASSPGDDKLEIVPLTDGRCMDLAFDTVYVVKRSSKSLRLHFVLRNLGDATAKLLGPTSKKEDNLAVNVYFVSGQKLTRGAFLADGMFFRDKDTGNGLLLPGQRLHGDIEISLRDRTKFQPNLVFELDPFQSLKDECDKTNNTRALVMEEE